MPTGSPRRGASRSVLVPVACVVVLASFLVRILAIAEPLGIDQSLWASAVRGLARGQLLYRDVWEQRPPGIYLTYLAGFSLLGWTPAVVAWLDVAAAALTSVLLFAVGSATGQRRAGALAAALFAALTMPAWLYSYGGFLERAVCETFIVVCVAGAAWCAVSLRRRGSDLVAWTMGLLAGVAVLYKPNAALYFPGLVLWSLAGGAASPSAGRRMRVLVGIGLGAAVLPLLTVGWLWHLGVLPDAKTAVVDFNRWYVRSGFAFGPYVVALTKAVWLRAKTDPLWFSGGVAALAAIAGFVRERRLADLPAVGLLWGVGAGLMIVVNGSRLYNSYFSQVLAPLALLAAWWITEPGGGRAGRRLARAGTAVLMAWLLWHRGFVPRVVESARADAARLTGRLDRTAYLDRFGGYDNGRGYSARANDELAAYVRAHTTPDERVYLFGINGAGVYFAADRLTAHRFLRVNFFVPADFPDPQFTLEAVVRDLAVRRPRYLIFETLHATSAMGRAADGLAGAPAVVDLLKGYVLETRIEDFTLYRRAAD